VLTASFNLYLTRPVLEGEEEVPSIVYLLDAPCGGVS
jgi:hypothetical protein